MRALSRRDGAADDAHREVPALAVALQRRQQPAAVAQAALAQLPVPRVQEHGVVAGAGSRGREEWEGGEEGGRRGL